MSMKSHIYPKVIFIFLVCILYYTTCFATSLPLTNITPSKLIEKTNAILFKTKQNVRCTTPEFAYENGFGQHYAIYVRDKDYRPTPPFEQMLTPVIQGTGTIMIVESKKGQIMTLEATLDSQDEYYQQSGATIGLMLHVCGLTISETTNLFKQLKNSHSITKRCTVWSSALNRYYILSMLRISRTSFMLTVSAADKL